MATLCKDRDGCEVACGKINDITEDDVYICEFARRESEE